MNFDDYYLLLSCFLIVFLYPEMLKFEIYYNLVYVFCFYDIVMYADLVMTINMCSRHLVL